MAIHIVKDVFATDAAGSSLPKYKMSEEGMEPEVASNLVKDVLILDGNASQNLSTFCQTWSDPYVHDLMDQCIGINIMDKDEYPASAEIESRCVHMIADLWNSPDAKNTAGTSTTGSSEAAMLGGLGLKFRWRDKRKAEGKPYDKPNIVTGPVQVCWHRFARYFDVELREVPIEPNRLGLDASILADYVDENTIGVVPTMGVTFTALYEPVAEICAALDKIQAEKGWDIPVHVDGASGGFLVPFVAPEIEWDFQLPRVVSINSSGHKFGLAPIGVGWIIWRSFDDLPKDLVFWVNYLGGNMPTFNLNFSRPGGQIASQYYLLLRQGKSGYREIMTNLYKSAQHIGKAMVALGDFKLFFDGDPTKGIPAISWTLEKENAGYSLYDLSDRLRMRGWQVSAYSMLPNMQETVIMRLVLRHGFSYEMADLFIEDVQRALDYFEKHPVAVVQTADEVNNYHDHSGRN
ncbi:glutamate decarboxylase [Ignatzschineria sp. LJL83]